MDHLIESIRPTVLADERIRIQFINSNRWIKYPAAERILNRLEELLVYPKIYRMPNLLVVGETNNGKTVLVRRFCSLHRPYASLDGEKTIQPVIYINTPNQPDEKRFFNNLLDELNAPYRLADKIERKERQAKHILKQIGTRMLIIDEIHNLLAGSSSRQQVFLNLLKNLANELQIVIVVVGTKLAHNVITTDGQIASRFTPMYITRWKYDDTYIRLLASFEKMLPLRQASGLADAELSHQIYIQSEGTIGEISTVITLAAIEAIKSGKEKIDKACLAKIDFLQPSARRRQPENIL